MTVTLTPQAQAGALPVRVAAPATYWDELPGIDRLASVNTQRLGKKTGWSPAGVIPKKWMEDIYPTVPAIINNPGNYERMTLGKTFVSRQIASSNSFASKSHRIRLILAQNDRL